MGAIRVRVSVDAPDAPIGVDARLVLVASRLRVEGSEVIVPEPLEYQLDADEVTECDGIPEPVGEFYYNASLLIGGSIYDFKPITVESGTVDWADVVVVDPLTFEPIDEIPQSVMEAIGANAAALEAHKANATPHTAYDADIPTLRLIFENHLI